MYYNLREKLKQVKQLQNEGKTLLEAMQLVFGS